MVGYEPYSVLTLGKQFVKQILLYINVKEPFIVLLYVNHDFLNLYVWLNFVNAWMDTGDTYTHMYMSTYTFTNQRTYL